jgi:phosphoadenosine phosphosulfate reductase
MDNRNREMKIEELNDQLRGKSAEEILQYVNTNYPGKIILGSSMGAEDQVLTDMLMKIDGNTPVFTLDTGRLFPETYELIDKTNERYGIKIKVYFPDKEQVEEMVNSKGVNLFYKSIENRKLCCRIRKIEPLKRALPGYDVWVTGLRKDQSLTRFYTKLVEWDDAHQIIKVNPLLNWTEKDVWKYIRRYDVPYNVLHDKGFPSIGCQPCTRAIKKGEDFRSGRWWWEESEHNECGLHVKEDK